MFSMFLCKFVMGVTQGLQGVWGTLRTWLWKPKLKQREIVIKYRNIMENKRGHFEKKTGRKERQTVGK